MIKNILDMLSIYDYYGISENVEIAKGKHELTTTFKGLWRKQVRENKYKTKKWKRTK